MTEKHIILDPELGRCGIVQVRKLISGMQPYFNKICLTSKYYFHYFSRGSLAQLALGGQGREGL